MSYLPLDRRFVSWDEKEGSAVDRLAALRGSTDDVSWSELRKHRRVVILAEAGSGKTEELREQARDLTAGGAFAFYSTVREVAREGLADSMQSAQRERLAAWRSSDQPAWLFIDSVDEAKLDRIQLTTALRKIADALESRLRRAHVILSGRITDWEFRIDLGRFTELLPIPPEGAKPGPPDAEVILARALHGEYRRKGFDEVESAEPPLVVLMAPLDEARVRTFAAGHGIGDSDPFIKAIQDAELWFLARRPLDLQWLVAYWKRHGRFGALSAMIEVSLQERLRETNPQRAFDDTLDPVRATLALERIGAAMVFGRTEKIAVEDSGISLTPTPGALRLEDVLPDWAPTDRRRLMTRAAFDPATYGCIRLHNDNEGTVRAFLTARWLHRLRGREGSVRTLLDRLFSDTYGYALVRPSLRKTSAWLALWDPDVAREVIAREPGLLLAEGDPGGLLAVVRSSVLTRTIEEMARTGEGSGLVQDETLRRLSTPDLAPTVHALWQAHKDAAACRALLLRIIALGALSECADIATDAVSGAFADKLTLAFGGRALMASADPSGVAAYADRVRAQAATLPGGVLWEALDQLFPRIFSVEDFLSIVQGMDTEALAAWPGLDYFGPRCAQRLRSRAELERLLAGVTVLVGGGATDDEEETPANDGHFPLLASIASALMRYVSPAEAPAQVIDIALRIRGAHRHRTSDNESKALIETLTRTPDRRRAVFWHVARAWGGHPLLQGRPLDSVWAMSVLGWPKHLELEDLDWVLADAMKTSAPSEAQLALDAALDLWQRNGRRDEILQRIRTAVAARQDLVEAVDRWLTPRQPSADEVAHNQEMAALRAAQAEQAAARDESWKVFLARLREDPDQLRHIPAPTAESVDSRLFHLWELLSGMDGRSRYAIDDLRPVEPVLGAELTSAFSDALISFWRQWKPTLESTRAANQRNVISRIDCMGICGVSVEAKLNADWPAYLTSDEARRAAEYATLELNGFPIWTTRLAVAFPAEVSEVFLREVVAEMNDVESGTHVGPLQDLESGPVEICRAVAAALYEELCTRQTLPENLLSQVLTILCRGLPMEADGFLTMILERASRAQDPAVAACYFGAAFQRNPTAAVGALQVTLDRLGRPERRALVEGLLPRLYGDGFRGRDEAPPDLPLEVMERLVAIAFDTVRVSEDIEHENGVVFSPSPRDAAERARNALFRHLTQVPGLATIEAIRRIGQIPEIPIPADRIEGLCWERAAADSESAPWPPRTAYDLERAADAAPTSAADLQALAVFRLVDIAYDLHHGDFTLGTIFKALKNENEVQRWVANELRNRQAQAYSLEREPHVADEKEPDIRLQARAADASVPIEIKDTASEWSLTDLKKGLTEQLCGRYLRARNNRHGIYLITHRQPRRWLEDGGKAIDFATVISRLQELADSIAAQSPDAPQVRICPIDVSDI